MTAESMQEIVEVFDGTALEGRRIQLPQFGGPPELLAHSRSEGVPFGESVVIVGGLDSDELSVAYDVAREAVGSSGRWPIATAAFSDQPIAESLFGSSFVPVDEDSLLDDEALDAAVEERFARFDFVFDDHQRRLEAQVAATRDALGHVPDLDAARAELGSDGPGEAAVDRWLFGWENAHGGSAIEPSNVGYLDWFEPKGQECAILLLPTPVPWQAASMLDFYGIDRGDGALLLSSLLRRWFIRWGAEPFANFGTMLEFHVRRPPTEADDLIQLAVEQYVVASDTIVLPGIRIRDHARALRRRADWFLHSRP